jgi:ABC-type antimicrobial peptide transport system permease subunit
MSAVQTMTKAVSVFNSFFNLIVGILISACIFIIISFGVKNVKSNIYEIGVLKALGCKFSRFVIIFITHTIIINILLFGISILGFYMISGLANTILTESLKQLAPSYIVLNLNFIKFNFSLISLDNILISSISLISTLVPMILLKKIKPIAIIKAKE